MQTSYLFWNCWNVAYLSLWGMNRVPDRSPPLAWFVSIIAVVCLAGVCCFFCRPVHVVQSTQLVVYVPSCCGHSNSPSILMENYRERSSLSVGIFQNLCWSHRTILRTCVCLLLEEASPVLFQMGPWCHISHLTLHLLQISHQVFWISYCTN